MSQRPRLSLCIPTRDRAGLLEQALASALGEAAAQDPGQVEVLVCDDASCDGTADLLERARAGHPGLRVVRHPQHRGPDQGVLTCMEEAHGEFAWALGDDQAFRPGAVARALRELDGGADACLCPACPSDPEPDPVPVPPMGQGAQAPAVWRLDGREELARYFAACAFDPATFATLGTAILRRDRFLRDREALAGGLRFGFLHLWGLFLFLRQPTELHCLPEPLVQNQAGAAQGGREAGRGAFQAGMKQLLWWAQAAGSLFGSDPEVRGAFLRIPGRDPHSPILPGLRRSAPDAAVWRQVVPLLELTGFAPARIAAVDLAWQHMFGSRLPMPSLDPAALCIADLRLLARGARRVAVLALGGPRDLYAGAGLLARLRAPGGAERIRVCAPPGCACLLDGFEVRPVDPGRYAADAAYRGSVARDLAAFAPELVVNLDPERRIQGDDLANAALPAGAIAFELPRRGQDEHLAKAADAIYTRLLPRGAAMFEALGLAPAAPTLWPSRAVREETRAMLAQLGFEPARTLAVLAGEGMEVPPFQVALEGALAAGWNLLGLGSQESYRSLERLLEPLGARAANLAGALELDVTAALLQELGGFLGGGELGAMAAACACLPFVGVPQG